MSGRGILDADMQTLGRLLAEGWRWWIAEIRDLVPRRLRGRAGGSWPRLLFRDGRLIPEGDGDGGRAGRSSVNPRPGSGVIVMLPGSMCLMRRIERPAVNHRDLQAMVAVEADTLLPFPSGRMIVGAHSLGPAREPGKIEVEIAGIPIAVAREVAETIAMARLLPERIVARISTNGRPPIDFTPAMTTAGLIARRRSATPLIWALVGFLAALNIAGLIWRDAARVARLEQLVEDQQPAVTIAQTIARRAEQGRAIMSRTIALRRRHDALGDLEAVGNALPDGGWLQRYAWDGLTVRLTGYRPARTDVTAAFRKSGHFAEVRSMNDETQATVPAGEPFDIHARVLAR